MPWHRVQGISGNPAEVETNIMPTCEIEWIGDDGKFTPDNNEAIGRARVLPHVTQVGGRGIKNDGSEWFNICACHAQRLNDRGMQYWEFEAFDGSKFRCIGNGEWHLQD